MPKVLIHNIGQLLTLSGAQSDNPLGLIEDALVVCQDGVVTWLGPKQLYKETWEGNVVDAQGALVSPGLVDPHTHLIFAGDRKEDFYQRLAGVSYERIQAQGGGIYRTVHDTRIASNAGLKAMVHERLDRFLRFGVTTVEVKSGYGLDAQVELDHLRLLSKLEHPVTCVPSFLGAHVVPHAYVGRRHAYIEELVGTALPVVAHDKLARFCDVFCDPHAFSIDETREILEAARREGLNVKLHADQLAYSGGAELAAQVGATSVDHLEYVSEVGISALAQAGVVAVLIPGCGFSMRTRRYAPARRMIDAGIKVALSTDCNPGTSYTEHLPFAMSLGVIELGMSAVEVWQAVTIHAAKACGETSAGRLYVGGVATFVIWDAQHFEEVPYRYASCLPRSVYVRGHQAT